MQTHDTIKRTARQWAHEVATFKERKEQESGETLTVKKLSTLYRDMATKADSTSAEMGPTDAFITDALKVYEKLLQDPVINGQLDILDVTYGLQSCLNNLSKLKVILEKTESLSQRQWVICWITDALTAGGSPPMLTNDGVPGISFFFNVFESVVTGLFGDSTCQRTCD